MTLRAIGLNCSLKGGTAPSSTEQLVGEVLAQLVACGVGSEGTVRVVDHDIKPGVTSDEGEGDEWPALRHRILDADILVLGTPIWLGQPSSVAKRVLERMDAFVGETDDAGRMPSFGKVAIVAVVGNEDGAHHVSAELYQALKASGGKMVSFGVDFGAKPTEAGRGAAVLFVLIALVVITGFWQVRQMTSRTTQVNPQMQVMNRITPFMSGFFSLQLPGGVTVYFLISNLFRVTQQSLMYRFDPHLSAHMEDVREIKTRAATQPPQPKKGLMASLREQAEAREANRGRGNPSNGNGNAPKSNGTSGPKPSASGRVTQPGQRGNAPRKRNKKRR